MAARGLEVAQRDAMGIDEPVFGTEGPVAQVVRAGIRRQFRDLSRRQVPARHPQILLEFEVPAQQLLAVRSSGQEKVSRLHESAVSPGLLAEPLEGRDRIQG